MAIVSDVEIRLRADIARLQQDMTAMRRTVDNGMSGITRSVEAAKKVLAGLGGAKLLKELASQLVGAQREFDKLNASLVTATGSSAGAAQAFGALQKFAATTPYSVSEATEAFIKLRNLGLSPSEKAMTSYGNTSAAMGKSLNQMIEAVADAATGQFERLKEFGITAKQQGDQVFLTFQGITKKIGNNSKEIQAYLRAIGDVNFNGAMEKRANTLDGAISNLGDTWDSVLRTINTNGFGQGVMSGVLALSSALVDLSAILDAVGGAATKEGKAVQEASGLHKVLTTTFEAVAAVGVNVAFVFQAIGKDIGTFAAQVMTLFNGGAKGLMDGSTLKTVQEMGHARVKEAEDERKAVDEKTAAIVGASAKAQAAREADAESAAKSNKDTLAQHEIVLNAQQRREKAAMDIMDIQNKANGIDNETAGNLRKMKTALDEGAISQSEYNKFVAKTTKNTVMGSDAYKEGAKAIDMSTEAIKRREQAQVAANKAEQEMLDYQKAMGSVSDDDYITQSAKNSLKALADQKTALEAQRALIAKRYDTEAARAALLTQIEAKDQEIAAAKIKRDHELDELDDKRYRAAVEHTADLIESAQQQARTQQDATRDMQDEIDALGLTSQQLAEVTAARKRDQAAELDRRASIGIIEEENEALRKQADELRKQADLGLTKERVQSQQKFWGDIEQTAHDVFLSIGDSSKSLWQRMKDSAKTLFFDWLYSMTLKKWIINIGTSMDGPGAVAGLLGGSGSGATGGSSAMNLISAGQKVYEGFTSGFAGVGSSLGGYVTQLGDMFGSTAISSFGSGMSGAGGIMAELGQGTATGALGGTGTSTAALSAGGTAGAAMGAMAGIAGGVYGGRMISGGYGGNGAVNTGTAIGAVVGSIIPGLGTALGALIGGMLGGAYNRLFGYKDKEIKEKGISGNFDMHGFDGNAYANWTQKGGWFRSDKSGQDRTALDSTTQDAFAQGFAMLKSTTLDFAKSLGITSDVVKGYSHKINLVLTDDAAKNQEAIAKLFTEMGDELAVLVVPSITQFSKEGETASVTLQRVVTDFKAVDAVMDSMGRSFGQVGVESIAARERLIDLSGGMEAFGNQAAYFLQNFYSEAEKSAMLQKPLQASLDALGFSTLKTTAQFKDAVLALDLTTEKGAEQYAGLMALAPQFKTVTDYMEGASAAAAQAAATLADAQATLKEELLDAQGDSAGLLAAQRARELAAMDASLRPMKERIYALQDEKTALEMAQAEADKATEKAAALASARAGLEQQLMEAQGNAAGVLAMQRAQELEALDESLRPMKERIYALQDERTATEAAAAAASAAAADMATRRDANMQMLHGAVDQSMAALGRAVNAQKDRINAAFDASMKSFDASISTVNDTISRTSELSSALKGGITAVPGASNGGSEQAARAQIQTALAIAKASGVLPSADDLAAALSTVGQDSSDNYATLAEYQRAVAQTNNALESLGGLSDHQLDAAQRQLQALNDAKDAAQVQHEAELARLDAVVVEAQAQIDAINGVNTSVLSVAQAVAALQTAIGALKTAPTATGSGGILAGGKTTVEDLYQKVLGRAPDAGGLAYWKKIIGDSVDEIEYMDFVKGAQEELAKNLKAPPVVASAPSGTMANSSAMLNELQTLNNRMANVESGMNTTAKATGQFAQQFHQVSGGGNALATENV